MRFLLAAFMLLTIGVGGISAAAVQDPGPGVRLVAVETWIQQGANVKFVAKNYLAKDGRAFQIDAAMEAHLRQLGAGDEWIAVLKQAEYRPGPQVESQPQPTPTPQAPPTTTQPNPVIPTRPTYQPQPGLSRNELKPLYFGGQSRIGAYTTVVQLKETGGTVTNEFFTPYTYGDVFILNSTPIPQNAVFYGLSIGMQERVGLDIEMYLQDPAVKVLNFGVSFDPFLPLGKSGVRLIAGATPFVGIVKQNVGYTPSFTQTGYDEIDVVNYTYGANLRLGLAYHIKPGVWLFGEWQYRFTQTWDRELQTPDGQTFTGLPWPAYSSRGSAFRFGIGW